MNGKAGYAWILSLLLIVPIVTGNLPSSKANIMWWLSFLIMGIGGSLTLYYMIKSLENMKTTIYAEDLVIDYSLGKIKIPLGIIKETKIIDKIKNMIRLGGVSLPGIIDAGYYYEKELGRIKAFLTRKTDLLLITLKNNAKIIISPKNTEVLEQQLKNRIGKEEEKPIRVESKDAIAKGITLIIFLLSLTFAFNIYQSLPNEVPVHFDSNWQPDEYSSKTSLLGIVVAIFLLNIILLLIGSKLSRGLPGYFLVIAPYMIGLNLILVSLFYLVKYFS